MLYNDTYMRTHNHKELEAEDTVIPLRRKKRKRKEEKDHLNLRVPSQVSYNLPLCGMTTCKQLTHNSPFDQEDKKEKLTLYMIKRTFAHIPNRHVL